MSSATNSFCVVGKWGQGSFTKLGSGSSVDMPEQKSKFFKSRQMAATPSFGTPVRSQAAVPVVMNAATPSRGHEGQKVKVCVRVRPALNGESKSEKVVEVNKEEAEVKSW